MKTAAALIAAFAVFRCVPDGKYRRALVLGAIATGTALAGHVKQRRELRPWQ